MQLRCAISSQKQLKESRKRHFRARNMIFLGLIFSGPVTGDQGGSLTQPTPIVWMSVTTRVGGWWSRGAFHQGLFQKKSMG